MKSIFMLSAIFSILAVFAIFIFLFMKGLPAINKIGIINFLFGRKWRSTSYDTYADPLSGAYGIFNMIVGSLYATAGAVAVGGTLGFFTAVFLAKFCPKKLKKVLSQIINLLAGIPSVVYGFFGMKVLLPVLGVYSSNGSGSGIAAVSLVLGVMILPTVVALSKTSLEAVPESYMEGALALGAKYDRAVFSIAVPAAKSGITASIILGIGRAIGETMAVVMVAGNSAVIPKDIFSSFRTMTGNVVIEMSYAGELQMGALIATGCVLFVFILIINSCFRLVLNRSERKERQAVRNSKVVNVRDGKELLERGNAAQIKHAEIISIKQERISRFNNALDNIRARLSKIMPTAGMGVSFAAASAAICALMCVVVFVFIKGSPYITWEFLTSEFEYGGPQTIFPSILATLMLVLVSVIIAMPLGIFTAIYLNEYAGNGKFVRFIRLAVETLGGIPSIIYGLFGMIVFSGLLKLGTSIISGALTVAVMIIPVTVRSAEEALKSVPDTYREGSFALGAGKVRTIFKVVLPAALPGVVSAVILGISRILSESAPLIFTMGASLKPSPENFKSSGTTLAVALYKLAGEGLYVNEAYATACILIMLVLGLNILASLIGNKLQKKLKGA